MSQRGDSKDATQSCTNRTAVAVQARGLARLLESPPQSLGFPMMAIVTGEKTEDWAAAVRAFLFTLRELWGPCVDKRAAGICESLEYLLREAELCGTSLCTWPGQPRGEQLKTLAKDIFTALRTLADQFEGGKHAPRTPKWRGRKSDTDPQADEAMADAWSTKRYKTYADLANEKGMNKRDVKLAIDRHRKRGTRGTRGCRNKSTP